MLRNFCFTLNNYTEEEEKKVQQYAADSCVYLVYGREVGEEKTPHLQGYAELSRRTRFNTVQNAIPRAHLEARRGTQEQALTYCKKEGNFEEYGEPRRQGVRTDVISFIDQVRQGVTDDCLLDTMPHHFSRFTRLANRIRYAQAETIGIERHQKPVEVFVFWGCAGTGKTRRVWESEPFSDIYQPDLSTQSLWFDGYSGQRVLLLDDYRGCIRYDFFLKLLDRYHLRIPVKGSFTYKGWSRVYITSNVGPHAWYDRGLTAALRRRLTHIIEYDVAGEILPEIEEMKISDD